MDATKTKPFNIDKKLVYDGYKAVKANAGAAGVDKQTLEDFDKDLMSNLYKIWNRMSSGSYFPPPVRAVAIPKKTGGQRILGVPTVADRVAQMVVKQILERTLEPLFMADSYGYRPNKSALDAVEITSRRCRQHDWVLEFDIRGLLDRAAYCTPAYEAWLKSSGCEPMSLRRKPFLRPHRTWMASISPRLTRCHTVCRETPSRRMAWYMVR